MEEQYTDIAFVGAFWNCAERAEKLLTAVRPWFKRISIAVQESPDNTLEVVQSIADVAIPDQWYGHGNISFQKAIDRANTPWCLLISDDEMPDETLLHNLGAIVNSGNAEGYWIHFVSTIEGFDFSREQDNHLRLFKTKWGWPSTIHSRPMIPMEQTVFVSPNKGNIHHDRTIDEMISDYLRRYEIGKGDRNWTAHNLRMMRGACTAVARLKGVQFITSKDWWPEVEKLSYTENDLPTEVNILNSVIGAP